VGTIALLFTDIEGSTRLAGALGSAWGGVLADHHELVGGAISAEGGFVEGTGGDAFFATFQDAEAAARAAVAALRALRSHEWPAGVAELRVRMGLHVGHVERRATGYVGLEVHRAARVAAAAHGGQLLLTGAARGQVGETLVLEPLGVHRLKDFPRPEELFCAVVDGRGAAAFPAPRTELLRPTNLPAGLPTLVGRESELERVRGALIGEDERLVTLTGRGGVGKTSVALQAATDLLDEYPGGVWLVRLATMSSSREVLQAVASTVGAERESFDSPLQALIAHVRVRGPTLVVLDNMEHLLAATPELATLLDELPQLRVLVTSQAPLRLAAERCLTLDSLDDEAALALMQRTAERRSGGAFSASDVDRDALLEIAHLLDGLPLALELAAARLALLSPAQLLERLRGSSDVLKDAGGTRPERQRSVGATVEWTLGLLQDAPRELFTRMGVFAGPVELKDLELITGADGLDVLEALAGLVEVALVRRVESGDGRVRFGLPEALRQIAAGLLDSAPDGPRWRRAHAQRQHDLVWAARTLMVSAPVFRAAVVGDAEAAAAMRWAYAAGDPMATPLAAARATVLALSGRVREAATVLEPLLESLPGDPAAACQALVAHSLMLTALGEMDEAMAAAERAVDIAPDTLSQVLALTQRGWVHTLNGEPQAGVRDGERASALARELDPAAVCGTLMLEAQARIAAGELDSAAKLLVEAGEIGAPVDATLLDARDTIEADLALLRGRPRDALEHYARSMESAQAHADALQVWYDLCGVASALAFAEEDATALEVLGVAESQAHEVCGPAKVPEPLLGREHIVAAEKRLGPHRVEKLKARGVAVSAGQRVVRACDLARLAKPV
jgi:predicted ATPase/class 3 adenylate cyclase